MRLSVTYWNGIVFILNIRIFNQSSDVLTQYILIENPLSDTLYPKLVTSEHVSYLMDW